MAVVSITRLRLRSVWSLPKFLWYASRSNRQAKNAAGNLGTEIRNDAKLTFWTKSTWKDEASMRAFLLSGAHRDAMPLLAEMCDEASTARWVQEESAPPAWSEVNRRMLESGRPSKVKHPSADHVAGRITPMRGQ